MSGFLINVAALCALIILFLLTTGATGFLVALAISAVVASVISRAFPGDFAIGYWASLTVGTGGCWLGGWFLDDLGPSIGGIALIPATIGAVNARLLCEAVWSRIPESWKNPDTN